MVLRIMKSGKLEDIHIKEGEIFLLPPKIPHSPQRFEDTVGLVVERKRHADELDGFQWYCDECNALLYEKYISLTDIVAQLPPLFEAFWEDEDSRTCKECNAYLEKP
jgi:3-hydroxyanthranilate 3,4-dioxygenase